MKKISVLIALLIVMLLTNTITYASSSDIDGPSTIHKEANQVFTVMDLLSLYERDVFILDDEFTGYGNVAGEYHVILTQGDATKDVTIYVVDKWDDLVESTDVLFVADFKDIYVSNDRMLTLYEILYYIYGTTGYIDTSYQFRYEEFTNEYHESFNDDGVIAEGDYDLDFRLTYFSGNQAVYDATIHTEEIIVVGVLIEAPPTTIDKLMSAFPYLIVAGIIVYYLTHRKKKRGNLYD